VREGDHVEDRGVDGRIILKRVLKWVGAGMDWLDLAQVGDSRRDFVNAVMNLPVSSNLEDFSTR
jgi:hypothetical protein